jgi:hypothetical protein
MKEEQEDENILILDLYIVLFDGLEKIYPPLEKKNTKEIYPITGNDMFQAK